MLSHPEVPGGQGEMPSRSDLAMQARALREDWAMGPGVRADVLKRAYTLAKKTGKNADGRVTVAAMRVLIAAGGLNIRQQLLDLRREELARNHNDAALPPAKDLVAEMLAEAEAYERDHGGDQERAGEVPE